MTELQRLLQGRERIQRGFCQRRLAADAIGRTTDPEGPTAVRWCLLAAIGPDASQTAAADRLRNLCGNISIGAWNDIRGLTQDQVLALLDRAIDEAQREAEQNGGIHHVTD